MKKLAVSSERLFAEGRAKRRAREVALVLVLILAAGTAHAEPTVQQILDGAFGAGCGSSQWDTGLQVQSPARYRFALIAKYTVNPVVPFGWYPIADPSMFTPLFDASTSPGAIVETHIAVPFGVRLRTFGDWSSQCQLNSDGFDHVRTFADQCDTVPRTLLCFEDGSGGGDQDLNDYVVEMRLLDRPIERPGLLICTTGDRQVQELTAASDGQGGSIVAWTDGRHDLADLYAQRLSAEGKELWAAGGVPVVIADSIQDGATIAPDGTGGAVIFWRDSRPAASGWYAQRLDADGTQAWGPSGLLITSDPSAYEPNCAPDGQGGLIIVWYRFVGAWRAIGQRVRRDGTFAWGASGTQLVPANNQQLPRVASDGAGGAIVVFVTGSGVGAQRVDSTGTPRWGTYGVTVAYNVGTWSRPTLASTGDGGAVFAWSEAPMGSTDYDVYVQRFSPAGSAQWASGGIAIGVADGLQINPQIVGDGLGGVMVGWDDQRSVSPGFYIQHVSSDAHPLWAANGVLALGVASGIVPDGTDGCYLSASLRPAGLYSQLCLQHLTAAGSYAPCLSKTGLVVRPEPAAQGANALVAMTGPGVTMLWRETTNTTSTVFAWKADSTCLPALVDVAHQPFAPAAAIRFSTAPNPFRTATEISFDLSRPGPAAVSIYDVSGRRIRQLFAGDVRDARPQRVRWDGVDAFGQSVPAGLYFASLSTPLGAASKPVLRLR